jgi:hypothetical protein
MPTNAPDSPQGPFEGSRCLAAPDGHWRPATIRRVNEDGTFTIEFDLKEMAVFPFMPCWYGITSSEISFNDARQWAPVFAQISPDGQSLRLIDFPDALASIGFQVPLDKAQKFWEMACQKLFNEPGVDAKNHVLDEATSYQLFLHLGISAKRCAEKLQPNMPTPYFKLYWNHARMGGREPANVARRVRLDDAIAALGMMARKRDRSAAAFLQRFERQHSVRLPATLVELLHLAEVAEAVIASHPNNPSLVEFQDWKLRRGMREQQLSGDYALEVMVPHQGDHVWAVVFDDGEVDARVYVQWQANEGETWLPTAPEIGMFFWDLAQTGFAWYQHTRFSGGRPVKRSDIGLILDSSRGS